MNGVAVLGTIMDISTELHRLNKADFSSIAFSAEFVIELL
jgi:hypothetical protein